MCYHIFLAAGPEELARHFGRKADLIRNLRPPLRACAFSHLPYPVLTGDEQIRYSRWGLIPYWLRRPEDVVTVRNQTVNARAETIFENASFRVPIRQRRCLVPVSGFYGWRPEGASSLLVGRDFRSLVLPRDRCVDDDILDNHYRSQSVDALRQQRQRPDARHPSFRR